MVRSSGSQRTLNRFSANVEDEGGDVIFATALVPAAKDARPAAPKRPTLRPAVDDDQDEEVIFAESWPERGQPITSLPETQRPSRPASRPMAQVERSSKRPAANETEIFASAEAAFAAPVLTKPVAATPVLTTPRAPVAVAPVVEAAPAVAASNVTTLPSREPRMLDVDLMWRDFDLEIEQGLASGHCPHCDDLLSFSVRQPSVTCKMCGSTYSTFHAYVRQGNA